MAKEYDTTNFCAVGVQGDLVRILAPRSTLTRDEAIRLAAWLTCMADVLETQPVADRPHTIEEVKEAVRAIEAA